MKDRLIPYLTLLVLPAFLAWPAQAETPTRSHAVARMFKPPVRPALPPGRPGDSANPINVLLLARLRQQGLSLSPRADKLRCCAGSLWT